MKNLYLIRHGKTEANLRHLYCGSTDLPLSEEGIRELEEKRIQIPDVEFRISGMLRTRQTLRILFGEVPFLVDSRFREVDFGVFEMKSYEQLKDDPVYQKWISGDNESNVPPNGESGIQMRSRVLDGVEELLTGTQDVALITHGGVIAAIMDHLFPELGYSRYRWQPKPGEGYRICFLVPDKREYHPL